MPIQLDPTVGPFRYDVVDVGRQVLSNLFADVHVMNMLVCELSHRPWCCICPDKPALA